MPPKKKAKSEGGSDAAPTMIYRPLGQSGIEVSAIALGCFAFGGDKKTGTHLGAQMTAVRTHASQQAETVGSARLLSYLLTSSCCIASRVMPLSLC